jgi:hypothetical protein
MTAKKAEILQHDRGVKELEKLVESRRDQIRKLALPQSSLAAVNDRITLLSSESNPRNEPQVSRYASLSFLSHALSVAY